jgi:hypothetical protein
VNAIKLWAHYERYEINGHVLEDVIEVGGLNPESEHMLYAKGHGLVGWKAPWGQSGFHEALPAGDAPKRERLGC